MSKVLIPLIVGSLLTFWINYMLHRFKYRDEKNKIILEKLEDIHMLLDNVKRLVNVNNTSNFNHEEINEKLNRLQMFTRMYYPEIKEDINKYSAYIGDFIERKFVHHIKDKETNDLYVSAIKHRSKAITKLSEYVNTLIK